MGIYISKEDLNTYLKKKSNDALNSCGKVVFKSFNTDTIFSSFNKPLTLVPLGMSQIWWEKFLKAAKTLAKSFPIITETWAGSSGLN